MDKYEKIGEPIPVKEDHKKGDDKKKGVVSTAKELHPTKNIVLVGRTGNGKSATGNSILGLKAFPSKTYASGVTMECKSVKCVTPQGTILNVIDTPGLFDMSVSADFISKEIVKCLCLADGGLHAVLLVLTVRNRVSKEEEMVLSTLQILFGSKICEYLIIVFSAGDVLEDDDVTLDEYLGDNCPAFLKRVLILCGNRKILFDNKTKEEEKKTKQIDELLNLIDLVGEQNKHKPYTDEMYHKIKEENDRYKREQVELESKGRSENELKALRNELQITNELNLKAMADLMERNIKIAMEAQEKVFEIREKAQEQSFRDKIEIQKMLSQMSQSMRTEMEAQIKKGECAIL